METHKKVGGGMFAMEKKINFIEDIADYAKDGRLIEQYRIK